MAIETNKVIIPKDFTNLIISEKLETGLSSSSSTINFGDAPTTISKLIGFNNISYTSSIGTRGGSPIYKNFELGTFDILVNNYLYELDSKSQLPFTAKLITHSTSGSVTSYQFAYDIYCAKSGETCPNLITGNYPNPWTDITGGKTYTRGIYATISAKNLDAGKYIFYLRCKFPALDSTGAPSSVSITRSASNINCTLTPNIDKIESYPFGLVGEAIWELASCEDTVELPNKRYYLTIDIDTKWISMFRFIRFILKPNVKVNTKLRQSIVYCNLSINESGVPTQTYTDTWGIAHSSGSFISTTYAYIYDTVSKELIRDSEGSDSWASKEIL